VGGLLGRKNSDQWSTKNEAYKGILMVRLSAVGDVVRTLPSLAVLRKNFPSARIAWLVEDKSSDILLGQPELDDVIVFPRTVWANYLARGRWWSLCKETRRFIRRLRRQRFDLVIDFHGIFKSGLFSRITGAGVRVGFDRDFGKEWNYLFNNWRLPLENTRLSRFERNLNLLQGMRLDTEAAEISLYVSPEDQRYADDFVAKHGLAGRYPLVAIHPGTSEKTRYKRWFPARYAQVADGLVEELGASILVTWGPGERGTAEEVQSLTRSPCVVSCPTKSLKQLAAIYGHCHLYIGGDTGPMHIASLMRVPVVVIHGPTDPVINAPYSGTPASQVRKDLPCSPCRDRHCQKLDCLKAIGPKEVLKTAKDVLLQANEAS